MIANERVTHRLSRLARALVTCGAIAVSCYPVLAQSAAETQESAEGESRTNDDPQADSGPTDAGLDVRSFRISAQDPATGVKIAAALELLGANCDVNIKPGLDPEAFVFVDKKAERKIAPFLADFGLALPEDDRTVVYAASNPGVSEDGISDDVFSASFKAPEVRAALGTWADHPPTQKKLISAIDLLGGVCEVTHDSNAILTEVKVVAKKGATGKIRNYLRAVGFQVDKKESVQPTSEPKSQTTPSGEAAELELPSRSSSESRKPGGAKQDQGTGRTDAAEQPDAEKTQRVYALQFADARQVHEIVSAIKQLDAVVEVHAPTNQVVVHATAPQHREVEAAINSQEPPKSLAVIDLTKSDPKAVQVLVQEMFEGAAEDAPKINADLDRRRLIVRGTPTQVRQVRNLIVGLELLALAPAAQKESDQAANEPGAQSTASNKVDVPTRSTALAELEELKWQPKGSTDKWDADRVLWLRQIMLDLKAIKAGATRGHVDEMLVSDGPTRSSKAHRYQHPKCPFVKLDVFFDVETGFAPTSPDDTVTRVEGPFVDLSSNWGRW